MFLVMLGLLAMNMTGSTVLLFLVAVMVASGVIVFARQGKKDVIEYELGVDTLLLRRGVQEERLPLEHVIDANLIDLVSAKDYVQQHGSTDVEAGQGLSLIHISEPTRPY